MAEEQHKAEEKEKQKEKELEDAARAHHRRKRKADDSDDTVEPQYTRAAKGKGKDGKAKGKEQDGKIMYWNNTRTASERPSERRPLTRSLL